MKMSVRIKLDTLTDEHKKIIRKHLFLQPKETFFKRKSFASAVSKDPVLFYYIDKPHQEIILPYTFANSLLKYHVNSTKKYPKVSYKFKGKLRDYQIPVFNQCMNHLKTKGTTILGAYPSFGKTIVSSYMSSFFEGVTLVLYPLTILRNGWYNTFSENTTASIWINEKNNKEVFDIQKHNVILTMDTQFHKISEKILKNVKVLIIDECHMFCTPGRMNSLLGTSPRYIIACTATLERTDGMESMINCICGTQGVFLKNPKPFSVYKINTGISVEMKYNSRGQTIWAELVKSYCENNRRNAIILDIVMRNLQSKIMILTWNRNHAFYLKDLLIKNNISSDVLAGNKNTYEDSKVLVGTAQKIGTAFDEKLACPNWSGVRSNILMLVGSTKSLSGLHQFCGRVFRSEYPSIIDFVDDNPICKRHWSQRKKYYLDPETKGIIHEADYTDIPISIKGEKSIKLNVIKKQPSKENKMESARKRIIERLKNKK